MEKIAKVILEQQVVRALIILTIMELVSRGEISLILWNYQRQLIRAKVNKLKPQMRKKIVRKVMKVGLIVNLV